MGTSRSWLRGLALALPLALLGCGGTGNVSIGDGGGGDGADDQGTTDGPEMDRTTPPDGAGDGPGVDGTHPGDSGNEAGPDGTPFDAPHDVHEAASEDAFETGTEDFFDGPFEDAFDAATEDADAGPCTTTCVPPVPGSWNGPEELYANSGAPPSCGSSFNFSPDYDGYAMLNAPAATCSTCVCGAATGVTCSVEAVFFSDSTCTMPCTFGGTNLPSASCTDVSTDLFACGGSTSAAYVAITSPLAGGSCAGSKETPTIPPATWGTQSQACSPALGSTTGTCPGSEVCVPRTDPSYMPIYCIYRSGNVPCPSTGYTSGVVFYGNHTDTRGCTSCKCDPVNPSACGASGSVEASDDVCLSSSDTYTPLPESCASVPVGTTDLEYQTGAVTTGGMCPVTLGSGQPDGNANPTEPTTFCCTP